MACQIRGLTEIPCKAHSHHLSPECLRWVPRVLHPGRACPVWQQWDAAAALPDTAPGPGPPLWHGATQGDSASFLSTLPAPPWGDGAEPCHQSSPSFAHPDPFWWLGQGRASQLPWHHDHTTGVTCDPWDSPELGQGIESPDPPFPRCLPAGWSGGLIPQSLSVLMQEQSLI